MSKVADYQQEIREAIEQLEKPYATVSFHGDAERVIISMDTADLAITALRAQLEPGWIKVSERLPTKVDAVGKLEEVLIYTDGKPNPIPYHCITFCPEGYDYWAPLLPEPPKESK